MHRQHTALARSVARITARRFRGVAPAAPDGGGMLSACTRSIQSGCGMAGEEVVAKCTAVEAEAGTTRVASKRWNIYVRLGVKTRAPDGLCSLTLLLRT